MIHVNWCSNEAAKFACEHYHYSHSYPSAAAMPIGVWDDNDFIGAIVFGRGANNNISRPFNLEMHEVCELTRVALKHHDFFVTEAISKAIKLLRKTCPGLKLIVSYADIDQGHVGKIYQASNWIYLGISHAGHVSAWIINGKKVHPRSIYGMGIKQSKDAILAHFPSAKPFISKGKHKYLYPMTKSLRHKWDRIALPYPQVTP